jgi:hypothetical protein
MDAIALTQSALDRLLALGESGVPVLRATVDELARLERAQERISSAELATTILRDPLMTLRVLHYLSRHRTRSQTHDITTIAHAIMMLGLQRFFREFSALSAIEDMLGDKADRISAARAGASRMRLAALFAEIGPPSATTSIPKRSWSPHWCTTSWSCSRPARGKNMRRRCARTTGPRCAQGCSSGSGCPDCSRS